jgi:hypothetical protein
MAKKQKLRFARGHAWGMGRPTQTHGDQWHKRMGTRGARPRAALKEA